MGTYIIKLPHDGTDYYMEWTSISNGPRSYGMTLDEFKKYYRDEYGRFEYDHNLQPRLDRVDEKGTSSRLHDSAEDVISGNRCGPNDTELTKEQIIEAFIINREMEEIEVEDVCRHEKTLCIDAKCSDRCCTTFPNGRELIDYVPRIPGIGGGDYVSIKICINCHQVVRFDPEPIKALEEELEEEYDDES